MRETHTPALNHPHFAHIHGVEDGGDVHALVMELVEDEDLVGARHRTRCSGTDQTSHYAVLRRMRSQSQRQPVEQSKWQ